MDPRHRATRSTVIDDQNPAFRHLRHRREDRQPIMEQSMNERPRSVEKASGDALVDDVGNGGL